MNKSLANCYIGANPVDHIAKCTLLNEANRYMLTNIMVTMICKEFAIELTEPLTHIFNKCIHDGIFPESLKTAAITPIPKEKTVSSLDQLRPISLTPIFARVF